MKENGKNEQANKKNIYKQKTITVRSITAAI